MNKTRLFERADVALGQVWLRFYFFRRMLPVRLGILRLRLKIFALAPINAALRPFLPKDNS